MKKYVFACAAFAAALSFTSCGTSKESAYRKAYEKAKAQEMAQQQGQQAYGQQQYVQQDPVQYQQPVQQYQQQQYQQPVQQQQYQQPVQQQQYQQPVQQQQYQQPVQQSAPTVTQMVEAPVQQPVQQAAPVASAPAASNNGLKAFSVVVGAFGVRTNADGLQNTLRNAGYSGAQVIYDGKMYRVVASTHDTREAAQRDQAALKAQYAGAWIMAK